MEYDNLIERLAAQDLIPMADGWRTGILVTSPLAGGVLTGKYNPSASQSHHLELLYRLERTTVRVLLNLQIGRLTQRNLAIATELMEIAYQIEHSPSQVALN